VFAATSGWQPGGRTKIASFKKKFFMEGNHDASFGGSRLEKQLQ
jgi:hypothetical protein